MVERVVARKLEPSAARAKEPPAYSPNNVRSDKLGSWP